MKKGYSVINHIDKYNKVIIVSNYNFDNKIINWGFNEFNTDNINEDDLGVWKIKNKN